MEKKPKISTRNITKRFKGVLALNDVSVDIYPGEIHSFAGTNGAGKSTLMKIILGVYQPTSGMLFIDGKETLVNTPRDANEACIAMVFQELNLFVDRTVAENVLLDDFPVSFGILRWKKAFEMTALFLKELGIDIDARVKVNTLSLAQKQLVEIAKCVRRSPQVLIFDEPSSSLSQQEEKILYSILRSLKQKGMAIVFITHKMGEILEMADRVSVLRDGELISSGLADNYTIDDITKQMLGKSVRFAKNEQSVDYSTAPVVLKAQHICHGRILKNVSFQLHQGEILAITGLVGSGKSELVKTIYGVFGRHEGVVEINGQKVSITKPADAVEYGLAYLPINRKEEGIFFNFTVTQNISTSILDELGFLLSKAKERKVAQACQEAYDIKTSSLDAMIDSLSGGNQQKVILARWLAKNQQILILDEPTRGIDVGAKQEIYNKLKEIAKKGMSFLLVSSEVEEILSVADRVIVIRNGETICEEIPGNLTSDTLLQYMMAGIHS